MYRPEPDQDKAERHANLLFVFVAGILIGASLMALVISTQCDSKVPSPRYVDNERVVIREVQKVVNVPRVVTREVDITQEVEVMRVVTREVTKEIDSPRVVTRVVEIIDGTPTTPALTSSPTYTPAPPTATPQPSTPTPAPDAERCELWRDYGAKILPLATGLIKTLASEVDLIVQAQENPSVISTEEWQAKIRKSLTESDFSARTISRTKAPDQFERRTRPIDTAVRSLLERNAVIRDAFEDPESVEDWEGPVLALLKVTDLMQELYDAQAEEAAIQFDVCGTFDGVFQTDQSHTPATSAATPPSTTCNLVETQAYFDELLPIAVKGSDAFQRTEDLINIVESNPFAMQDASWRRRMESVLDDIDTWATAIINVHPPDTMSRAHKFYEAAARLYMERITPNIRSGITSSDSALIRSVVADTHQAADLMNDGTDCVEDYLDRCE